MQSDITVYKCNSGHVTKGNKKPTLQCKRIQVRILEDSMRIDKHKLLQVLSVDVLISVKGHVMGVRMTSTFWKAKLTVLLQACSEGFSND
jgi:hypothetical protein